MAAHHFAAQLALLIPLWLSLSVHEWAHAAAARLLGDDTAERLGRLTLNPLAHLDPLGTVLLPLLGVPFGWAKPVPFNPLRFRRRISISMGTLAVAAAGPLSNLTVAVFCTAFLAAAGRTQIAFPPALLAFSSQLLTLNVLLALFNILPIYPLDGSRIADALVPEGLRPGWEEIQRYSPVLLFALIFVLPIAGIDLFGQPLRLLQSFIAGLR